MLIMKTSVNDDDDNVQYLFDVDNDVDIGL